MLKSLTYDNEGSLKFAFVLLHAHMKAGRFFLSPENEKPDGSQIHFCLAANFQIPDFRVFDRMTAC
jgi:hypothetical protein|tara:strand:+ start:12260 stop:12457 length:198 start_codon:yes stop_codon:yes gene_type:complete